MNDAIETVIEILDAFAANHAAGRVGGRGDYAAVADRIAAVHACSSDPALLALREAQGLLHSFVEYDDAYTHREAVDALSTRIDAILSGFRAYPESVVNLVRAAEETLKREWEYSEETMQPPPATIASGMSTLRTALAPFADVKDEAS